MDGSLLKGLCKICTRIQASRVTGAALPDFFRFRGWKIYDFKPEGLHGVFSGSLAFQRRQGVSALRQRGAPVLP